MLGISEENGLAAIDTHINPPAGCVLLLTGDLKFKPALAGGLLGRIGNELIVEGNMIHFAPTHPESLAIYDPERRQFTPIYPAEGDTHRIQFSALLGKHRPSRDWRREFNNPCDPKNFTVDISHVQVDAPAKRFTFDAEMSPEGFGPEAARAIQPQTVHYECQLTNGKWILRAVRQVPDRGQ